MAVTLNVAVAPAVTLRAARLRCDGWRADDSERGTVAGNAAQAVRHGDRIAGGIATVTPVSTSTAPVAPAIGVPFFSHW